MGCVCDFINLSLLCLHSEGRQWITDMISSLKITNNKWPMSSNSAVQIGHPAQVTLAQRWVLVRPPDVVVEYVLTRAHKRPWDVLRGGAA